MAYDHRTTPDSTALDATSRNGQPHDEQLRALIAIHGDIDTSIDIDSDFIDVRYGEDPWPEPQRQAA